LDNGEGRKANKHHASDLGRYIGGQKRRVLPVQALGRKETTKRSFEEAKAMRWRGFHLV